MVWWLQMFERKLVETLLRSPTFHRSVQKVHKKVHEYQHGQSPQYPQGGTELDNPEAKKGVKSLVTMFWEELKTGHKPQPKGKQ